MSKIFAIVLAILATMIVAACGGNSSSSTSTTTTSTTTTPTTTAANPPCTPSSFYMQCADKAPGQTHITNPTGAFSIFGVDTYGAGNPGIRANFDCSYLSGYPGGKDWTAGGVNAWVRQGKKVCVVWETYANRAEYGYGAGQSDAYRARAEAAAVGFPSYVPIRFAVDTDTSAANVTPYFQGVKSVLGNRTGVYGSYQIVSGLESRGITTPATDWQTLAWSYGQRSRACLYQSGINTSLDGQSVDYDSATCANYGQYPYQQKQVIICFGPKAQGNSTCRTAHADIRKWQIAATASNRVYVKRGCVALANERNLLNSRWNWFWTALRQHPNVKRASRERALASTGRKVDGVRRTISGRSCLTFSSRTVYFNAKIQAVKKKYS